MRLASPLNPHRHGHESRRVHRLHRLLDQQSHGKHPQNCHCPRQGPRIPLSHGSAGCPCGEQKMTLGVNFHEPYCELVTGGGRRTLQFFLNVTLAHEGETMGRAVE